MANKTAKKTVAKTTKKNVAKESRSTLSLVGGLVMLALGIFLIYYGLTSVANDEDLGEQSVNKTSEAAVDTNETEEQVSDGQDEQYTHRTSLADVTEGETFQGIATGGSASGEAKAVFENDTYNLIAEFSGLPEPINGSFYEGWLVADSGDFFTTGVAEIDDNGNYVNTFTDGTDWTETHNKYILTLEPNDGNPAPADHIVEGTLSR